MQNDQQKRLLIVVAITTLLWLVWSQFFMGKEAPVPPAADGGVATPLLDAAGPSPAPAPSTVDGGVAAGPEAPVAPAPVPEKKVTFSTETQELVFTNQGGALDTARVKNGGAWPQRKFQSRKKDEKGELQPVDMVRARAGLPLPGSTEIRGELALPFGATYEVEQTGDSVTFRTQTADLSFEKRYRLDPRSYELRVDVTLTNRASAPKQATLALVYPAWLDPKTEETGSFFSPPVESSQAVCRHGDSNESLAGGKEAEKKSFTGPVRFAGFSERYFMGVFFPRFIEGTSCVIDNEPSGSRTATIEVDLGTLAPGQSASRELGLYIGPKSHGELERVSHENLIGAPITPLGQEPQPGTLAKVDPELTKAIDFGWWAVICKVLLEVMKVFQKGVVNWGIAIVLLTVLVKAILYPLSVKQMASMEAMRRLQPQMDALTKKYENDKEKLNMERMRLFQENKVNPFGGCLPLLIQMPVWIALYTTLQNSFELYREPLIGFWISDLTAHDPFYILPLAMGVTMFITQKMQPTMGDPTQAKIMLYFMPIFFTFLMLSLPAGLTLYIFTNNLLSIAQQKYLQRKFARQAEKPKGEKPKGAKK
ncbi:MAG: membrane protein insertase YidC [Deltaproteobacteria bacterium]|nr:membrane protein insertase YidC [Deltaproteobacteria bacterium]